MSKSTKKKIEFEMTNDIIKADVRLLIQRIDIRYALLKIVEGGLQNFEENVPVLMRQIDNFAALRTKSWNLIVDTYPELKDEDFVCNLDEEKIKIKENKS